VVCFKETIYNVESKEGSNAVPTGFALHGGRHKVCYNCDAGMLASSMAATGKANMVLDLDPDFGWLVVSVAGTLRFHTYGQSPEDQMLIETVGADKYSQIRRLSFRGPDNALWQAYGHHDIQGFNTKLHCQRVVPYVKLPQDRNPHALASEFVMFKPFTEYEYG